MEWRLWSPPHVLGMRGAALRALLEYPFGFGSVVVKPAHEDYEFKKAPE